LRLSRGIDPDRFAARTGIALADALEPRTLADALEEAWLTWAEDGTLAATPAGRLRLDALLPALLR
jgi:oxygen-independent coproporphyrinogen-3 oxidase